MSWIARCCWVLGAIILMAHSALTQSCDNLYQATRRTTAELQADFVIQSPLSANGWKVDLQFSDPVTSIKVRVYGTSDVQVDASNDVWTISAPTYSVRSGDTIQFETDLAFTRATNQRIVSVVFNGVQLCTGSEDTSSRDSTRWSTGSEKEKDHSRACEDRYRIETEKEGEWTGRISFPIHKSVFGWILSLHFSSFVRALRISVVGSPSLTSKGNTCMIRNPTSILRAGTTLNVDLTVSYLSAKPWITEIVFNDVNICRGHSTSAEPTIEGSTPSFVNSQDQSPGNEARFGVSNNDCGRRIDSALPFIVGGQISLPESWPWHAAVYRDDITGTPSCGGTLVSRSAIVTAAHCVTRIKSNSKVDESSITIYLGLYDTQNVDDDQVQRFQALQIIVHPDYQSTTYYADIAVVRLDKLARITEHVRLICLEDYRELDNKKGFTAGWGIDASQISSRYVRHAVLPAQPESVCNSKPQVSQYMRSNTFCAGYANGTSVCNGDSGGGWVLEQDGTWYLRGITSIGVRDDNTYRNTGRSVCDPDFYAIFTDVNSYLDFIKKYI